MSILSSPGLPGIAKLTAPSDSGIPDGRAVIYLDGQHLRWRKKSTTSSGGPVVFREPGPLSLMPDVVNQGQAFSNVLGQYIWLGALTGFATDADNPYGQPTLTFGTTSTIAGKQVWLDWLGAYAGQTVRFVVNARAAAGTFKVWATFYQYNGTTGVGSYGSDTYTFDGATQEMVLSITVPGHAYSVKLYVERLTGSSAMSIYDMDWWVLSKEPRYAVEIGLPRPDTEFVYLMRSWRAQAAKIRQADGTSAAVIALVGDSWVDNQRIWKPLRTALTATYGDAGVGWVSATGACLTGKNETPTGVTLTQLGTWATRDQSASSTGLDINDATSTDDSTPASQQLTATCTDLVIHYAKQATGGSFRYRVDSGSWTTVNTANATTAHATVGITGLSDASHIIDVELVSASTAGVTLCGYDVQRAGNGVRLHKIGNSGANAAQFAAVDETIWEAGLTALAPDVVLYMLGTNDMAQNVNPATFRTSIETVVGRVRAVLPYADVVLMSPAENGLTGTTYAVRDYALAGMRGAALNTGAALLNAHRAFDTYANDNARGLWANTSHLNDVGGQAFADLIINRVLSDR